MSKLIFAFGLFLFLPLTSLVSIADDNTTSHSGGNGGVQFNSTMPPEVYKNWAAVCAGIGGTKNQEQCDILSKQFPPAGQNTTDTCRSRVKEFTKHANEFKAACQKGGISDPDPDTKKGYACARNLQACGSCQGASKGGKGDDDDEDSDTGIDCSKYNKLNPTTPTAKTSQIAYCPTIAAADIKQWEKDVDTAQKAVDDLRKQIPDMQAQMAKVDSDVAAKKEEMTSKSAEADSKFRDRREEIEDGAEGTVKTAVANKRQMQDKYDAASDEIQNQKRKIEEAYLTSYKGTIRQLEMQCHATALKQVEDMRQMRLAEIKTSSFTVNGFNELVGRIGLTDMQRDQMVAQRFYNLCVQDKAYAIQAGKAADDYHAQYKRSADAIDTQKREQIKNVQDQNNVLLTDIPQAQAKALRAMNAARKDRDAIKSTLQSAQARLDNDALTQKNVLQTKLNELNNQLMQKTNFLNDKMAVLNAKQQASGGHEMSSGDSEKLWSSNSQAGEAADNLINGTDGDAKSAKCCPDEGGPNSEACANAKRFLAASGRNIDDGTTGEKVAAEVKKQGVTAQDQAFVQTVNTPPPPVDNSNPVPSSPFMKSFYPPSGGTFPAGSVTDHPATP
jgi:hypothetical protein